MRIPITSIAALLLLALFSPRPAEAQRRSLVQIYPGVLYPGENIITVTSPDGLKEIQASYSRLVQVEGDGNVAGCAKTQKLRVFVNTASEPATLGLLIIDCKGKQVTRDLAINTQWTLDQVAFGRVELEETVCQQFQIRTSTGFTGGGIILDSVTVPRSPDYSISLRLPGTLPSRIRSNELYTYTVCFTPHKTGFYKFPVITWIRREQPADGLSSYPVSDTGVARAVLPPTPPPPDTVRRIPPPDTIRHTPPVIEPEVTFTDPTTFRSVAVPNAVIPKAGSGFVGSYDLLGLVAGYSFADWGMILAGGALPTPDDWSGVHGDMFGAYSVGIKVGGRLTDRLSIAAGYQFAHSMYDKAITPDQTESSITAHVPYAALSYGTDDSRVSVTAGYAFKHHSSIQEPSFDRQALILAVGGDYRFATHWKVAGEVATMQTLGVVPIVGTVRYFTNSYAIDLGVGYVGITTDGSAAPKIPLAPVLSAVFVF